VSRMRKAVAVAAMVGGLVLAGAGAASADANAFGEASNSPGVLSGNVIQIPIHIPINVCGNSVNVIGALNPAFGNSCSNGGSTGTGTPSVLGQAAGWHQPGWQHDGDTWSHEGWRHHDPSGDNCC
jgi:hypothetical protein